MAAARSPHVESGVSERRLRPIYDCLDNGNNKKALQEAEKLLRKQKDFQCAKVLKALALLRLGKQEEAISVLQEVHREAPTDDPTLQAMTICYRELQKPDLIADVYASAVKKDPQNEEFMTHLFMAYVRLNDYKKQQQVAMNLYKLKPKNPYYFWCVMSIVMQAYKADEVLASTMYLPLAQKMTEKFIDENRIEAEAEVQLYLMILELQKKYDEALKVLNSNLGERLSSYLSYNDQRRAEYLAHLQKWAEANIAYKTLVLSNPDHWLYYMEYFRTSFKLIDAKWVPQDISFPIPDHTPDMVIDFILSRVCKEEEKSQRHLRGPFLARIELLQQLMKRNDPVMKRLGNIDELILGYYEKFGDRGCFIDDIIQYFCLVDEVKRASILAKIRSSLSSSNGVVVKPSNEREMQRHIGYIQLHCFIDKHSSLTAAEKISLAHELVDYYHSTCSLGKGLLPTDHHPNDMYCVLAVHLMIKAWQETGEVKLVWQTVVVLERALKNSLHNHQLKLLLIKLYNRLGAVGASYALYESLDIKHVQQDSLGYLVTRHLAAKGHFSQACIVFSNTLKFFMSNYKDTIDYLISSYKFGSFTKIYEFVKFRERLNNSLQYAMVTVERMILDLILETHNHSSAEQVLSYLGVDPEKDKTVWSDLRDNRDLTVMFSWDAPNKYMQNEDFESSFNEEVEWLKLRNLQIRTLAASYLLSQNAEHEKSSNENDVTNGEKTNMVDVLQDLLEQLKLTSKTVESWNYKITKREIQGPDSSRLYYYRKGVHLEVFINLVEVILYLNSLIEKGITDAEENIHEEAMKQKIFSVLEAAVKHIETPPENFPLQKWEELLENLTNLAETISFAAILCGICQRILKPVKNAVTRKKKKKKETSPIIMPQTLNNFNDLVKGLERVSTSLQNSLHLIRTSCIVIKLCHLTLDERIIPSEETEELSHIQSKLEKSYEQSLKELEDLIKNKIKYFASLQL